MEEFRNAYRVLVTKPEGKIPLERLKHRWEDNIKVDLKEVGCDSRNWMDRAKDWDQWQAYLKAVMNFWVP